MVLGRNTGGDKERVFGKHLVSDLATTMRSRLPAPASFTLIEVTLGLTILILIFGVIFQLVQFSVMAADEAAKSSLRSREVSGLFALVRQLCLDLPVQSQVRPSTCCLASGEAVLKIAACITNIGFAPFPASVPPTISCWKTVLTGSFFAAI